MDKRKLALTVVALVVVAALLVARRDGGAGELEFSGTVEATEAQLGFQAAGRIEAVRPREGDQVREGDTLAWLESAEPAARLDQARSQLRAAAALLAELASGARSEERVQAREALRALDDRYAEAERELARTRRLHEAGAVSTEQLDRARLQVDQLRSQREQAEQQLRIVETGPRAERIAAQRAVVAQAEAAVRQAEAQLGNAVIRAPFTGVVTVKHRGAGETAAPGAPVLTIMNLDDRWVRIFIPENRLGGVRLGDTASISADSYPERRYAGSVAFISSQAEFTPRNVQTREERVKLVYAVKVRIAGDPRYDLKPGLPADVRLHERD